MDRVLASGKTPFADHSSHLQERESGVVREMARDLDHTRLILDFLRGLDGTSKGVQVVDIINHLHMPAIGGVSLAYIFGEGELGVSVDGDVVVIVENDELSWYPSVSMRRVLKEVVPRPKCPAIEEASLEIPSCRQPSPQMT
jgi:hypothetical protein